MECGVWSCELDTQLHQNNINTNKSNTLAIKTTPSRNCTNSPSIFNTNTTIRLKSSDIGTNQYIAINIAILCYDVFSEATIYRYNILINNTLIFMNTITNTNTSLFEYFNHSLKNSTSM